MQDAYDFWSSRIPGDRQAQIEAMWARFAQTVPDLQEELTLPKVNRSAQLGGLMSRVLGPFSDRLEYEFAPGPSGVLSHTLIISAGMRHDQRVLARAILDNAPDLPGWDFADARPAVEHAADALDVIRERDGNNKLVLTGIEATPGAHRRIDATPEGNGDAATMARQAGHAFTALLGEEAARDWLGKHQPKKRSLLTRLAGGGRGKGRGGWCDSFRNVTRRLIDDVKGKLPEEPFWKQEYDRTRQVMYQANQLELNPAWRHDTITGYTNYRQMTQARMTGDPLSSPRFSRFGESFCGLKVARTAEFHFDETEQRVALAEGAHLLLSSREEGGVTGEAHGRSHVYIDLAMADLAGGVATLAELLDTIELTGPAWLIFDEAGLTDLSIPLTPRTPATPKESYK